MNKRSIDNKVREIIVEYNDDKIKLYDDFALAIKTIIEKIIENKGLKSKIQVITHRVKERVKLEEKLKRPEEKSIYFVEKNINKFTDVDDLAGVRVVFYLGSEAEKFSVLVKKELKNITEKVKAKFDGYKAIHLVVNDLEEDRLKLIEYSRFRGLKCEIQLTTPLLHAWSELEHDIIYKPRQEIKKRKTMALEILDERFKDIMINHINEAGLEFESIAYLYGEVEKGHDIFMPNLITESGNNNKIYQQLLLLEKYTEKLNVDKYGNKKIMELLDVCIKKAGSNKAKNESSILGELPGKKLGDIAEKALDIVENIKYVDFTRAFKFLVSIYENKKLGLREEKVLEIVKNFSKYKVVRKAPNMVAFLYKFQSEILGIISGWESAKQIRNLKIINKSFGEILEFSYELSEMQNWNTISLISGPLVPNDELKNIRKGIIDLIIKLYGQVSDIKSRIDLLHTLENVSRFHSNTDENGRSFILGEIDYIVGFYENIIIDEKGEIIAEAPIIYEIEERLILLNKNSGLASKDKIEKILSVIRADKFYGLYRILVGDIIYRDEGGYDAYQKKKSDTISDCLKKMDLGNVEEWKKVLNDIAKYKDVAESWTLQGFNSFLQRLAEEKPEIAEIILDDAFKHEKPLLKFADQALFGFRRKGDFNLWDKYVGVIIKNKLTDLFFGVLVSFLYIEKSDIGSNVRKCDIDLFEKAINGDKPLEFLRKKDVNKFVFHSSLIRGLLHIHKSSPKRVEKLVIHEVESNPLLLGLYTQELHFMEIRGMVNYSKWAIINIKYILNKLVELKDLNYDAQEVLLSIGKKKFDFIMDVFIKRIKKAQEEKPKKKFEVNRYEAIPFNFNENLKKHISENKKYFNYAAMWSEKMTKKWSVYNWELGQFIERIDSSFDAVLKSIIKKGDKKSLNNAVDILKVANIPPLEICFEIVKKTNDKKILDRVASAMYATGTVSGEYGFSNAHRKKAESLKGYLDSNNKRVKDFAIKMIEDFNNRADEERKREEKEVQLRKEGFEK